MKTRIALAAALCAGLAAPTFAQATFYVVQDTQTKECTIVETKPTTKTTVIVGDGKVYTTRTEAQAAVKTIAVCKN